MIVRLRAQPVFAAVAAIALLVAGGLYLLLGDSGDEATGDPTREGFDLLADGEQSTTTASVSQPLVVPTAAAGDPSSESLSDTGQSSADVDVEATEAAPLGTQSADDQAASPSTTTPNSDRGAAPTSPPPTSSPTTSTAAPASPRFDLSYFDVEGSDPRQGDRLVFDALAEKVVTPNGNGWRHEVKIDEDQRVAVTAAYEDLQATLTAHLASGAKTIVAQHHASDTGTIVKVYISDTAEGGFDNSVANDGIFDVYVRLARADGNGEEKRALGTIRSGDSFTLRVLNDRGLVTVSALGESFQLRVKDSSASFLKFGNYLQAQDPVTLDEIGDSDDWAAFYREAGIDTATIVFSQVTHVRQTD